MLPLHDSWGRTTTAVLLELGLTRSHFSILHTCQKAASNSPYTKSPGMTSNICNYNSHLHSKHRFCFQLCCLRGLLRGYIQRTPEQALSCSFLKLIKPLELKKFSLWKRSCSSLLLFALVNYQKKKKEYKDIESLKITYQGKNSKLICSSSIPRRQTDMICKQHKLVQVLWGATLCLLN